MQAPAPAARLFPRESKSNSRGVGASFRRTAIPNPTTAGRIAHLSDYHKRLSLFLAFARGAEIFRGPQPDRGGAVVQRPARLYAHHRSSPSPTRSSRCSTTTPRRSSRRSTSHRRRAEADRRRRARDLPARRGAPAARRSTRRRQRDGRRRLNAPPRRRAAGYRDVSRPPYRRGLLRQYRQQGAARLHRHRPAVNEVSRIAAMCRSVDQPMLLSAAFADSIAPARQPFRLGRTIRAARRRHAAGFVHARRRRTRVGVTAASGADRARRAPLVGRRPRGDKAPLRRDPELTGNSHFPDSIAHWAPGLIWRHGTHISHSVRPSMF